MSEKHLNIEKKLLSIPQAADVLQIAPHTFRVWLCEDRVIPKSLIIYVGSRVRIHAEKLYHWIDEGCLPEPKAKGE